MNNGHFTILLLIRFINILDSIYLLFLYLKTQEFFTYLFAHILNLSLVLSVDNIIRILLIPHSWCKYEILKYFQAFILVSLDKYIFIIITIEIFILYIGVMKTQFYFRHEKDIFLITVFGGLFISLLLGGLYLFFGIERYGDVYYYAKESDTKKTMDTIFITVFLILNTFFSIVLIFNMIGNKDRLEKCLIDIDYDKHVYKIILKFIANSLVLVESYLIIFGKLPFPDEYIDLTYSATCLFVNLVYSINTKVIEETKKLIYSCCNPEKESHKRINTYEIQNSKNIKHSSNYDSNE